jgi:hypothetical protein
MEDPSIVIGVDPGKLGGAFSSGRVDVLVSFTMPEASRLEWARDWPKDEVIFAVERVSAMPRDGLASAFEFGRQVGRLEGTIRTLGFRIAFISPQTWQILVPRPKNRIGGVTKAQAIAEARRRFGDRGFDEGTADAALIWTAAVQLLRAGKLETER